MKGSYNSNSFKKRRRSSNSWGGWKNYGNAITQVKRDLNSVKRMLNVETKNYDFNMNSSTTQAGVFKTLFFPGQGVGSSQREGNQCKVTDLEFRMEMYSDPVQPSASIRVILFWEKQYNAALGGLDVVQDFAAAGNNYLAPRKYQAARDYEIIFDKLYNMNAFGGDSKFLHFKRKLNKVTTFEDGTNTPNQNALRILFITDVATNAPGIKGCSRVKYVDN